MTIRIFGILLLATLVFSSCKKEKWDKDKYEMSICENDDYNDPNNYPSDVTQHIVEELVYDQSSGCITKGFVKYVNNTTNETVALVKYDGVLKDGTTYAWGYKTLCVEGKCADYDDKKKKDWDKAEWNSFLKKWAMENGKGEDFNQEDLTKAEWTKIKKEWAKKYGKKKKKGKGDYDKEKYENWCKFEQVCTMATGAN